MLCFGGGVLLATVMMHMLGEVRESLEIATEKGKLPKDLEYPFAELMVGLGTDKISLRIKNRIGKLVKLSSLDQTLSSRLSPKTNLFVQNQKNNPTT